jgi:hypothetical protein
VRKPEITSRGFFVLDVRCRFLNAGFEPNPFVTKNQTHLSRMRVSVAELIAEPIDPKRPSNKAATVEPTAALFA